MKISFAKTLAAAALISVSCIAQFATSASAQVYTFNSNPYNSAYYNPYANPYAYANPAVNPYIYNRPSVFTTHPILSGTLLGTAVGAAGGLAVGAIQGEHSESGSPIVVDTAIGAGTGAAVGAGVGMIRNKVLYGTFF